MDELITPPNDSVVKFYQPSGKAPPLAILAGAAFTGLLGAAIGSALGAAEFGAHLIPSLKLMAVAEILSVFGAGHLVGLEMARVLGLFKARSPLLAYSCTFFASILALYFAWVAWIYAYCAYSGNPIPYTRIVMPTILTRAIVALNAQGSWSLAADDVPTGLMLTGIWSIEVVMLMVCAFRASHKELRRRVFCEQCETWGSARHLMSIADTGSSSLQAHLLTGRTGAFDDVSPAQPGYATWCDVILEGCPTCDNLQALTLQRSAVTRNKKGRTTTKSTILVRRLLVTPEQTVAIALKAASFSASAPSSSVTSPADLTAG
jgi:hypothetical protein